MVKSRMNINRDLIRKSIHFATGIILFILSYHLEKPTLLILLIAGTIFSFVTFYIRRFEFLHGTIGSSLGTLFYPVGLTASFLLLYNLPLHYFQITVLFLSVSDAIANIGGYIRIWNPRFTPLVEEKSLWGVAGFSLTAFIILRLLLPGSGPAYLSYLLLGIIVAINLEIISYRGSDNLSVPFGSAVFFFLTHDQTVNIRLLSVIIPIMALIAWILSRKHILTRYGSILAYILGIYYFAVLGFDWSVPVVFFFISSVIFTDIKGLVNKKPAGTDRRNIWQVLANIIVATVCSAIYLSLGKEIFIFFYISLVSAVTADTWASELGPVFNPKCFSLSDGRIKEAGISGGISFSGTLASLAGAFSISILSYPLLLGDLDWRPVIILTLSGFLASFVDSLLGAFIEPGLDEMKYFRNAKVSNRSIDKKNRTLNGVEQSNIGTDQSSNERESLSPNDLVNLLASMTAPLFFLVFSQL
jgi:uncharacterized protein (TIGR00297 family)